MGEKRGGHQDVNAWCATCGAEWRTRNAHGVAVQHARKNGHKVHIETARHDTYDCTSGEGE